MVCRKAKGSGIDVDEPIASRILPLSNLVSNRDKALRKARNFFNAGEQDEARKDFERAE